MTDQRVLADRYEVGEVLGRGGMATVRRARDQRLNRDVAVKELRIDLASDATFQERFRREAQAAAGLNHPNIVSVFDTGEQFDPASGVHVPYIVMELVQGRTLRDILRDGRPILPRRAFEFTLGVLDALSYSHKAGIVHRDIKPANVMITTSGAVKVMDFGIARAVSDTSSTMTQTAAVIGTAQYLSPEQARGETVDARSDLYSAGCLLYELLVGRPPFTGDSPVSVAYQHVREAPTPPSQLDSEVTGAMDAIVLRALAKSPADRYQTAADMSADIRRLLTGQPVHASVPPPMAPTAVRPAVPGPAPMPSAPTSVFAQYPQHAGPAATGPVPMPLGPPSAHTGPLPQVPLHLEPPRRRGGLLWPVVTGLLLVSLVGLTFFLMFLQPRDAQVSVPSVRDYEQSAAEVMIRDKNLNPVATQTQGPDDATVGRVVEQSPAAGVLVDPGSDVAITVNVGPTKQILPSGIVGNDVNLVAQQLTAAGFTNVKPQPATSEPPSAKANQVLRVEPNEGSRVAAGQQIILYYASGQALVPAVGNYDKDIAAKLCQDAGFTNVVLKEQTSTATKNAVVGTDPAPGTLMNKTDLLTIFYAVPPTPTMIVTTTITTTTTTTTTTAPPPPTTATPAPTTTATTTP